jgi:hypothetical protein
MRAIFNIFHVSQLKKCLRVLEERVAIGNIKLKWDLFYKERPVRVIDTKESDPELCDQVLQVHVE